MFRSALLFGTAFVIALFLVSPLVAQTRFEYRAMGQSVKGSDVVDEPRNPGNNQFNANRANQLRHQQRQLEYQQRQSNNAFMQKAFGDINDALKNFDNNSRRQQPRNQSYDNSYRERSYQNNRNYSNSNNNRYYSNRSQPSRPSVSRPVITKSAPAVPKNTLPEQPENSELSLTGYENGLPNQQIQDLPPERIDPITGQLNDQLREELDSFNDSADNATAEMVDAEIDNKVAKGDIPPQLGEDLKNAIKAKDFIKAKELVANAGLTGPELLDSMYVVEYYEDFASMQLTLEGGLKKGYTAEQLQPIVDGFQRHLDEGGWMSGQAPPASIPLMLDSLDSLQKGLVIEESLFAGPPNSAPDWLLLGTDPMLVIFDPETTPGSYFRGGSNLLVVGSQDGHFHTDEMPFAEAMHLPIGVDGQAPTAPSTEIAAKSRLLFQNPKSNNQAISFQLQGKNYTIEPGEEEVAKASGSPIMRFDNGKAKTIAYTIKPGTYIFRIEDGVWNSFRSKFKRRVDNTNGIETFHFLVDNEVKSIEPGSSLNLESDFPLVVKFDPGNGKEAIRRLLEESDYTVAINRESKSWDLFATIQIAGAAPLELISKEKVNKEGTSSSVSRKPRW